MAGTFNTPAKQTIARDLMIAYLNTGTASAPVWSPFGTRTTDSSIEYDWGEDTSQDILGNTWTTMKKPVMTQSFDPWPLDGGDAAQQMIFQKAVIEQDAQALTNMDVLIAHFYSGSSNAAFAERYASCMVKPSSLGGEGGGNLGMPVDVTYGGEWMRLTPALPESRKPPIPACKSIFPSITNDVGFACQRRYSGDSI